MITMGYTNLNQSIIIALIKRDSINDKYREWFIYFLKNLFCFMLKILARVGGNKDGPQDYNSHLL